MLWFGWAATLYQGGCLPSRLICTLLSSTLSFTQGSEWHLGPPSSKTVGQFGYTDQGHWTMSLMPGLQACWKGWGRGSLDPLAHWGCAEHKAHHSREGNPREGLLLASWNEFPAPQSWMLVIAEGIPTTVCFLVAVRQLAQVALRRHMCPGCVGKGQALALTAGRPHQTQAHEGLPGAKCLPLPWENKAGSFLWNGPE